jgi:hypothetical protein
LLIAIYFVEAGAALVLFLDGIGAGKLESLALYEIEPIPLGVTTP